MIINSFNIPDDVCVTNLSPFFNFIDDYRFSRVSKRFQKIYHRFQEIWRQRCCALNIMDNPSPLNGSFKQRFFALTNLRDIYYKNSHPLSLSIPVKNIRIEKGGKKFFGILNNQPYFIYILKNTITINKLLTAKKCVINFYDINNSSIAHSFVFQSILFILDDKGFFFAIEILKGRILKRFLPLENGTLQEFHVTLGKISFDGQFVVIFINHKFQIYDYETKQLVKTIPFNLETAVQVKNIGKTIYINCLKDRVYQLIRLDGNQESPKIKTLKDLKEFKYCHLFDYQNHIFIFNNKVFNFFSENYKSPASLKAGNWFVFKTEKNTVDIVNINNRTVLMTLFNCEGADFFTDGDHVLSYEIQKSNDERYEDVFFRLYPLHNK